MECPSCENEAHDLLVCTQCGSAYCDKCQPDWDIAGEICSHCSESNTIAALKDDAFTAKMRRWFSKKANPPAAPELGHPLPWTLEEQEGTWWLVSNGSMVASFADKSDAAYACQAANNNYQLCGLMATIYNRIRAGDAWFNGGKEDCELWLNLKELLK